MSQASVGFPWFVVSVFVVGFLPGVLLLIAGRRGKRIDDHPVCRGCGFDLFGTREPIPDKHPKCPECGTRREPKVGNRKRRGKLTLAGVFLMLTSIGVAGAWGYGQFGAAQIAQYKPMWLLRFEARSGTSNTAAIALGEMIARFQNGKLTPATAELLFDDAVAHGPASNPALVNAPIGSRWDWLAAELMRAGHGTDAEREAIGRSWIETAVEVRPQVRLGERVPIRFHRKQFGPDYRLGFYEHMDSASTEMNGRTFQMEMSSSGGLSGNRGTGSRSTGWSGTNLRPRADLPTDLGEGVHLLDVYVPIRITDGQHGSVLAQWIETQRVQFEYVPADGDPIDMIYDPALAVRVEQAVALRDHELTVNSYGINSILDWSSIPADLAYNIFVQRGEQKRKLSTVAATPKNGAHGFVLGGEVPDEWPDGAVVDMVFEPAPDVARNTTDMTQILDHAFVIPDVKIVRPANIP